MSIAPSLPNIPVESRVKITLRKSIQEMDELNQIAFLYKRYPDFQPPAVLIENIRDLLKSRKYELL